MYQKSVNIKRNVFCVLYCGIAIYDLRVSEMREKSILLQISLFCFADLAFKCKRLQHRILDLRCCYWKSMGGKDNEPCKHNFTNFPSKSSQYSRPRICSFPVLHSHWASIYFVHRNCTGLQTKTDIEQTKLFGQTVVTLWCWNDWNLKKLWLLRTQ